MMCWHRRTCGLHLSTAPCWISRILSRTIVVYASSQTRARRHHEADDAEDAECREHQGGTAGDGRHHRATAPGHRRPPEMIFCARVQAQIRVLESTGRAELEEGRADPQTSGHLVAEGMQHRL